MQCCVELRLNPVEAHAVIQRKTPRYFPLILQIPFHVSVPIFPGEIARRLIKGGEHPNGHVGKTEAGVQWIARSVAEVDVAVGVGKRGLVLAAALHVDTGLEYMPVPYLREVVDPVQSRVVVEEGGIIRPDALLVANSCSRISKPWDEISLYCGGIEHRDVHSACRPR